MSLSRTLAVVLLGGAVLCGLVPRSTAVLAAPTPTVEDAVTAVATAAVTAMTAWYVAAAMLAVLAEVARRTCRSSTPQHSRVRAASIARVLDRAVRRCGPPLLRGGVLIGAGMGMVVGAGPVIAHGSSVATFVASAPASPRTLTMGESLRFVDSVALPVVPGSHPAPGGRGSPVWRPGADRHNETSSPERHNDVPADLRPGAEHDAAPGSDAVAGAGGAGEPSPPPADDAPPRPSATDGSSAEASPVPPVARSTPASRVEPEDAPVPPRSDTPELAGTATGPAPSRGPNTDSSAGRDAAGQGPGTAAIAPDGAADDLADQAAPPRPSTTAPAEQSATSYTVVAGDCLWSIAAAHLEADADDAAIAGEWPRWYAANATVIGPHPHLIHPGQVLLAPSEEVAP